MIGLSVTQWKGEDNGKDAWWLLERSGVDGKGQERGEENVWKGNIN